MARAVSVESDPGEEAKQQDEEDSVAIAAVVEAEPHCGHG